MQNPTLTLSDDELSKLPLASQGDSISMGEDELNQLPLASSTSIKPSPFAGKPRPASSPSFFNPDTVPSSFSGNQVSSITGKSTLSPAERAGGQSKLDASKARLDAIEARRKTLLDTAKASTGDAKKSAIRSLAALGPLSEEEQSTLGITPHYLQNFVHSGYTALAKLEGGIARPLAAAGVPGAQSFYENRKANAEENIADLNAYGARGYTGDTLGALGEFLPDLGISVALPESKLLELAYWPATGALKSAGSGGSPEDMAKAALSNLTPIAGGKLFASAGRLGSTISNVVLNEGVSGLTSGSQQQRIAAGLPESRSSEAITTGIMSGTLGYLAARTPSLSPEQVNLLHSLLKGETPDASSTSPEHATSQEPPGTGNPSGSNLQQAPTESNQALQPPVSSSRPSDQASRGTASQGEASTPQTPIEQSSIADRTPLSKIELAQLESLGIKNASRFDTEQNRGQARRIIVDAINEGQLKETPNASSGNNLGQNQGIPQGPDLPANPGEVRQAESGQTSSGSGAERQTLDFDQEGKIKEPIQEQVGPGTMKSGDPIASDPKSNLQQLNETIGAIPPDKTPYEKASITEKVLNALVDAKDYLGRSFNAARSSAASLYEAWKVAPEYTPLNKSTGQWLFATARALNDSKTFAKSVLKSQPNPLIREAITNYIQAGGDPLVLEQRAAASGPAFKPGYEAALKLTPDQITLANNISSYLESKLQEGISKGLLSNGIENYINQIWKRPNDVSQGLLAELGINRRLSTDFKYARKRVFDSYFEGEQKGQTPVTKDISSLIPLYDTAFAKAAAARNYIKDLYSKRMPDGRHIIEFEGTGKVVTEPGDFHEGHELSPEVSTILISPHARPRVEIPVEGKDIKFVGSKAAGTKAPVFETKTAASGAGQNEPGASLSDYKPINNAALRKWRYVTSAPDGTPVIMEENALVHPEAYKLLYNNLEAKSIFRESAVGRIALDVQNIAKQSIFSLSLFHPAQIAEHALAHTVNPFYNLPEIDYSNPNHQFLIERGLSVGDQSTRFLAGEGLGGGSLVEKIPIIGPKIRALNEWLFEGYIPRIKMKMAQEALVRNRARYAGDLTEDQIGVLTAKQANAAFGELNYKYMGRNPSFQDAMRLFLMAPDFLEARAKFAGQAVRPYGREQLRAIGIAAATQYVAARVLNKLSDDDYHWSPESAFSVHHEGQRYSIRTVPGDILEGIGNTRQFLYNRTSPIARLTVGAFTGRDYRGTPISTSDRLKEVASDFIPMSVKSFHDKSLWQGALDTIGLHSKKDISPGAQLAYEYLDVRKGTPGTPVEPEDIAKFHLKQQLRAKRDSGQSIYDEVAGLRKDNKLTAAEAHNLLSGKSEIYPVFQQLTKSEAIKVWDHLSTKERSEVKDLYARKLREP